MTAADERRQLVELLSEKGISDKRVLSAIGRTPREEFVRADLRSRAYENNALPLSCGQTISQPYVVASMTEALQLKGPETVLEIGTGSGYQAAILSQLCARVISIECVPELSERAGEILARLGCQNVELFVGDGSLGLPQFAPFDGILVTAAAPDVPPSLISQLKLHGRLVIPIGGQQSQILTVVEKTPEGLRIEEGYGCVFVKLIGEEGWQPEM